MSKSSVSKLAEAVSWFEGELKRLYEESVSRSNDIVRFGDDMSRELGEDIAAVLKSLIEDLRENALKIEEMLRVEYARRLEEELKTTDNRAKARFEDAVKNVLEEVKKIALGASS